MLNVTKVFCVFIFVSVFWREAMAEGTCWIREGSANVVNFPARNTIIAGRDVPINTVVYQVTGVSLPIKYACKVNSPSGIKPASKYGGEWPTFGSTVFPIDNTGLGFSVTFHGTDGYYEKYSTYGTKIKEAVNPPFMGYAYEGGVVTLSIIKISDTPKGPPIIPGGSLGKLVVGDLVVMDLKMPGDTQIVFGSCKTPDTVVHMGDNYKLSQFYESDELHSVGFSIKLLQCPEGLKSVSYRIEKAPGISLINGLDGVMGLNKESDAKGVGLRIRNGAGQSIVLGRDYKFYDYQSSGGDFEISLNASYVRLPGEELGAGHANTEAIFIMSYL